MVMPSNEGLMYNQFIIHLFTGFSFVSAKLVAMLETFLTYFTLVRFIGGM